MVLSGGSGYAASPPCARRRWGTGVSGTAAAPRAASYTSGSLVQLRRRPHAQSATDALLADQRQHLDHLLASHVQALLHRYQSELLDGVGGVLVRGDFQRTRSGTLISRAGFQLSMTTSAARRRSSIFVGASLHPLPSQPVGPLAPNTSTMAAGSSKGRTVTLATSNWSVQGPVNRRWQDLRSRKYDSIWSIASAVIP